MQTNTPWQLIDRADTFEISGTEYSNKPHLCSAVGIAYDKEDAELIIRAVNSHDELVTVLEMMLRAFNVKDVDPLIAFATIEKAKSALSKVLKD